MIVSFFEEFPTKRNLDKLKLVTWPTKLYIAAKCLKDFNKIKSNIKNKHVKEIVYWPILEKEEGYWISPFSDRDALLRVFNEAKGVPVMVDAEVPFRKHPSLLFSQLFNFFKNRNLIMDFVSNNKVYVAEYYPTGKIKEKVMSFLGLHFYSKRFNNKVIKMVYHSMHGFDKDFITSKLETGKKEFGGNFLVAYGTIAKGILGTEPLLSKEQLKEDLKIAKKVGIKEVVIFRLGGLNKSYAKVIKGF
ncbi:MAG: hypothetical protein V1914_02600 [archaeon]